MTEIEQEMQKEALNSVLKGSIWINKENLDNSTNLILDNSIFSLTNENKELIPHYVLDNQNKPIPVIKDVVLKFLENGATSFIIACWFESVNSFLGGKKPKDVINMPKLLLLAVEDYFEDIPF